MASLSSDLAFLPIKYPQLLKYADFLDEHHWLANEIKYGADNQKWSQMDPKIKICVEYILKFFAQFDGLVNENLINNFKKQTSKIKECKIFYASQEVNEVQHNRTYSNLIQSMYTDITKREKMLNSIENDETIKKMALLVEKWMNKKIPLLERIIAFMCVEGILFSSAFAFIYWLKKRNLLLNTLVKANEWIARDEGVHAMFAVELYLVFVKDFPSEYERLSYEKVIEIIKEFVDMTIEFSKVAIGEDFLDLTQQDMQSYIKYIADYFLVKLEYKKYYNAENLCSWMVQIGLTNKSNFFETTVTEYFKPSHFVINYGIESKEYYY